MNRYLQGILCAYAMIAVSPAETEIMQTQDTIMREIPAMLRDKTLGDKQVINGLTVKKRSITKQDAVTRFGSRMRDHMSDPDTRLYILVSVFFERKQAVLGGGDLFILYDKDTCECLAFYRTR